MQTRALNQLKDWGKLSYMKAHEGLPHDYASWDSTHVQRWAKKLGCGRNVKKLAANHVDGKALVWMTPDSIVGIMCDGCSDSKRKSCIKAIAYVKAEMKY